MESSPQSSCSTSRFSRTASKQKPQLAILFWFYKDLSTCTNHLSLIKQFNEAIPVFGLYGGELKNTEKFRKKLGFALNDFYTFPSDKPTSWKWLNGDLLLLDWYLNRGRFLTWDSVAIIQWDVLLFENIHTLFPDLKINEIFLSGLAPLSEELEKKWCWTKKDDPRSESYRLFQKYIRETIDYSGELFACPFVLQVMPRVFLERFAQISSPEIGMLEYKIPTYANIFNIPIYHKDLGISGRGTARDYPMNASGIHIQNHYIYNELKKSNGWRVFHPYCRKWNPYLVFLSEAFRKFQMHLSAFSTKLPIRRIKSTAQ